MRATQFSRECLRTALAASTIFLAGCAHPLGPGYNFADRQAEIRVSAGTPGRIRLHVVDQLENDGDRTLQSLEVRLPEGADFGQQNLHVAVGDEEITPQRSSPIDPRMMRAPFNPPWPQNETRKVVTEWDLVPAFTPRGTIVASRDGFFIADETAFPLWQTPHGVFARGGEKPDREMLTVVSPADFRVVAPGKPLKPIAKGAQVARRFVIKPGFDFFTYVVAGRYQQKIVPSKPVEVQFWTFHPLDPVAAETAAARLSVSMNSLSEFFGPASSEKPVVRIAESPMDLPDEFGEPGEPGSASFPEGALLDPRVVQHDLASEPALELAEYELARTWFGWRVRARPDAQILMGRGVGVFGLVIAAEGRGASQRRNMIESLIERYDAARGAAPDRGLKATAENYSRAERISTGYRAALFLVALEDLCGRDNLKSAMRDIIYARASRDTGSEELRAALEQTSKKDLAEMFRNWLTKPGIPEEFRNRYK